MFHSFTRKLESIIELLFSQGQTINQWQNLRYLHFISSILSVISPRWIHMGLSLYACHQLCDIGKVIISLDPKFHVFIKKGLNYIPFLFFFNSVIVYFYGSCTMSTWLSWNYISLNGSGLGLVTGKFPGALEGRSAAAAIVLSRWVQGIGIWAGDIHIAHQLSHSFSSSYCFSCLRFSESWAGQRCSSTARVPTSSRHCSFGVPAVRD